MEYMHLAAILNLVHVSD